MESKNFIRLGKRIAYILRHNPASINAAMDAQGWIDVKALLRGINTDMQSLEKIVASDTKQRYSFNHNKTKIRATQGHSLHVDLNLQPEKQVPEQLFHGTKTHFLSSILKQGLQSKSRQYVHLSSDLATAVAVANRRVGSSVILVVDTKNMVAAGNCFYKSENNVWLTAEVPPEFITIYQF
jgi:putative RNA 2'-phosphotransferase